MTNDRPGDGLIRTPDQRLRVFVSSTLAELAPERAAVGRAITALRLSPVMFELGARPHPPQELYRAYLEQSDIFIGLYWQSYGWIGPGMDISGLEDEFRLSGSRPRLLYLKAPAPERQPALAAMIAEIEAQGTDAYRTFRTTRELGRLVRDDLALLLSERFAGVSSAASSTQPPVAAPQRDRPAIPVASTSLIGRERDIGAVTALLDWTGARLVTLTGPGGIGKTRLAMAVAEELDERDDLRVVFVALAAVNDPALALDRIAAEAGVIVEGTRSPLDAIVESLTNSNVLMVLDNLEQVITIGPMLDQLLSSCPDLRILATSRTVLRLRAEHEYGVDPLPVPNDSADLSIDQVESLPAVQLFVDRAQAVRRGFALTAQNAGAVVDICRRLDGLPLAIELAAARIRLLDPAALLARLESVLDALGTGPVDLPERQRTLRATVEWSMGLLDDAERRLLESLSVFADGWTLDAALAVCGDAGGTTFDVLDSLAGHSLISVDQTGDEPRFRMLTTVRELAAERLATGLDSAVVQERHARYFASLIEFDDLPGDRRVDWARTLRTDEQNVRTALRWFFDHDLPALPHILRALWLFWQIYDRMPEARTLIIELERRVDLEALHVVSRAEVLFTSAVTAVEVGDDAAALAEVERIQLLPTEQLQGSLASALQLALSWALPINDDFDGALQAAHSAYAGFQDQHDSFVAFAALTVGMLNNTLGNDEVAHRFLTEVDELGTRFGNEWLMSSARMQLASLAVKAGNLDDARTLLDHAISTVDDAHISALIASFTLVAYAQLALAEAQPDRAATALAAAHGLRARAGLLAWPLTRRTEARLAEQLSEALDAPLLAAATSAGEALHSREALAFVRAGIER